MTDFLIGKKLAKMKVKTIEATGRDATLQPCDLDTDRCGGDAGMVSVRGLPSV